MVSFICFVFGKLGLMLKEVFIVVFSSCFSIFFGMG